jgi:hypothetical protein
VITVDGTPIRVVTGTAPEIGQVTIATRFLTGGFISVVGQQGTSWPSMAGRAEPAGPSTRPPLWRPPPTCPVVARPG